MSDKGFGNSKLEAKDAKVLLEIPEEKKLAQRIEKEYMNRLKEKAKAGKLMLDE